MIVDGLAEDNALFHSDEKGWAPLVPNDPSIPDQFLIVAPHVFRLTSRVVKTCGPPGFHFFACNTDIDIVICIYIYTSKIYKYTRITLANCKIRTSAELPQVAEAIPEEAQGFGVDLEKHR